MGAFSLCVCDDFIQRKTGLDAHSCGISVLLYPRRDLEAVTVIDMTNVQRLAMRIIHGTNKVHFPNEMGTGISMAPFLWAQQIGQAGLIYQIVPASIRYQKKHEIEKLTDLTTEIIIGQRQKPSGAQVRIMTPETLRLRMDDLSTPYMVVLHGVTYAWPLMRQLCNRATKVVIFCSKYNPTINSIINGD